MEVSHGVTMPRSRHRNRPVTALMTAGGQAPGIVQVRVDEYQLVRVMERAQRVPPDPLLHRGVEIQDIHRPARTALTPAEQTAGQETRGRRLDTSKARALEAEPDSLQILADQGRDPRAILMVSSPSRRTHSERPCVNAAKPASLSTCAFVAFRPRPADPGRRVRPVPCNHDRVGPWAPGQEHVTAGYPVNRPQVIRPPAARTG